MGVADVGERGDNADDFVFGLFGKRGFHKFVEALLEEFVSHS